MSNGIKIVTIGGGSSYTPELMDGFIKRYEKTPIREICLVDVEEGREKLEIIAAFSQRMWDASPYQVKITHTLNRRDALPGADFVTTQLRVGGLEARIKDERIPSSYGILGQETNGAGGILKAFRTIPVIGEIIADMRELCPEAWLINFTNPSGMVTEAAIKHFGWKKTIGLCNVPEIAQMREPIKLGKKREELLYYFFGLNHFHWHRVFDRSGQELTAEVLKFIDDEDGGTPVNIYRAKFPTELLDSLQLIPCGYHRYYYMADEMLEHSITEFNEGGMRSEQMLEVERKLMEEYKNPELKGKPESLEKRGGAYYSDAACECISAIHNNAGLRMVVSTENRGAIPCLPVNSTVEVTSLITANGAEPLAVGELKASERGWLQLMKAMEECAIEASISGDYGMALQAFAMNPLIRGGAKAQRVLDELLLAHEKHLPKFADKINQLKIAGVSISDAVVKDLLEQGK